MKKHEFKQNDFIIFDSMEQRVEYMSIAKANGYTLSTTEKMDGCTKGFRGLEMRFRENKYFTIWSLGSQTNEHEITPCDFLKLISQYEVGDEVEVLKSNADGCFAQVGQIHRITELFLSNESPHIKIGTESCGYISVKYVKLHKSISNKQTTTDMAQEIKVGDLLEVIKKQSGHCFALGEKIEVIETGCGHPPNKCKRADGSKTPGNCYVNASEVKIINNQKTTGMKKFKNRFAVTGSRSLLGAFKDELKVIGYKEKFNNDPDSFVICNEYNNSIANGEYHTNCDKGKETSTVYTLPQDWDIALAAAKETVEEQKSYNFGKRIMHLVDQHLCDTPTGGGEVVCLTDLKKWYKWYSMMPKFASGHNLSIPEGKLKVGCTTGTLEEAIAICKDLFKD